jgi:hypothetical protein
MRGLVLLLCLSAAGCAEEEGAAIAPRTAVAAAVSPGSAPTCGAAWEGSAKPCPLQGWMRDHVGQAMADEDFLVLASALDLVARATPDATWEWQRIARDAAAASRRQDWAQVRASCRECHERYRPTFKVRYRDWSLFRGAAGVTQD